jgi:hypothetical protein
MLAIDWKANFASKKTEIPALKRLQCRCNDPLGFKRVSGRPCEPWAKHGSWLNVAKIELSVLQSQCLDHSIPEIDMISAHAVNELVETKKKPGALFPKHRA